MRSTSWIRRTATTKPTSSTGAEGGWSRKLGELHFIETRASQSDAKGRAPYRCAESPIPSSDAIALWVAREILPHEAEVRGWLRRTLRRVDPDDVIQETYCRIAATADPTGVTNGRAYFFAAARNVAIDQMRRNRVVGLDDVAEIAVARVIDEAPSPERLVAGRLELRRVADLIESLPEKCRTIFTLRKVHGLPQREIAHRLGVSENVVEKQAARGLRLVLMGLAESAQPREAIADDRAPGKSDRRRGG